MGRSLLGRDSEAVIGCEGGPVVGVPEGGTGVVKHFERVSCFHQCRSVYHICIFHNTVKHLRTLLKAPEK